MSKDSPEINDGGYSSSESTPFVVNYVESLSKRVTFCFAKGITCLSTCGLWLLAGLIILFFVAAMFTIYGISTFYTPNVDTKNIEVKWGMVKVETGDIGQSQAKYYTVSLGPSPADYNGKERAVSMCITADKTEITAYARSTYPSLVSANVPETNSFWSSNEWEDDQIELFHRSTKLPQCSNQSPIEYVICDDYPLYITVIREADHYKGRMPFSLSILYDYCEGNCNCPMEDAAYILTSVTSLLALLIVIVFALICCCLYCCSRRLEKRCTRKRVFVSE